MKILIIHQYYKTPEDGGGIRSYHIANYLASQGHEVSVITAYNHTQYSVKMVGDVKVHYLPIYYTNHLSFLSRVHAFMRYVWQTKKLLKQIDKPDLNYIISTPLTTGLVALYAKRKLKIPYFFEVGDLWPEAPIQLGVLKNSLLKKLAYALEKRVYYKASRIVALSPAIKQDIDGKAGKQVTVVTNFSDTSFFNEKNAQAAKSKLGFNSKFVIAYIGTIGLANHLEYMLEAAQYTFDDPKIHWVIMGDGARSRTIRELAESKKLTNVNFVDYGDKHAAREMLMAVDAVYISFKDVPVLATGSPNKFFDGLAAGKLIIINFRGWIKELVEQHQCGFYYNPHDPAGLSNKLQPYLDQPDLLKQAQINSRKLAIEKFDKEVQLSKLPQVLEGIK